MGEPGEMVSTGKVTEKCGDLRWKQMFWKSRLVFPARDVMVPAISFCQLIRELTTKGPVCSKVQRVLVRGAFLLVRANQRKL